MTSLAVIFILLMVVFASCPPRAKPPAAPVPAPAETRTALAPEALAALTRLGLVPQRNTAEPDTFRLIVPNPCSASSWAEVPSLPPADQFLREVIPSTRAPSAARCATAWRAVVIEGHTDDLGGDAMNLRLSQERSFRVLVRGLDAAARVGADRSRLLRRAVASASGRGKQDLIYDAARRLGRDASRQRRLQASSFARRRADVLIRRRAPAK